MKLSRIISLLLLCSLTFQMQGQKTFYSKKIKAWELNKPSPNAQVKHSVFLIGDLKYPNDQNPVYQLLRDDMRSAGKNSSVLILGDIVYPLGMVDSSHIEFKNSIIEHDYVINLFKDHPGQSIFIPGNHDWERGRKNGWQHILDQEAYIEANMNRGNVYLPDGGGPGPVEVPLCDDIVLIVFDMQWFLQRHDKPGLKQLGFEKVQDFFVHFEDIIMRNQQKKIIVASHHPLFSVGYHGGYFPVENSIFPLLERKNWLYIPLPGFIYTGYRKIFGHIQDIAHPKYKEVKDQLMEIMARYPNTIYAAGHEHNLQYLQKQGIHHIVSGGGGEGTYISKRPKKADFAAAKPGYARIDFYDDGDAWITYISPENSEAKEIFRTKLFNKKSFIETSKPDHLTGLFIDSIKRTNLTDQYDASGFKKVWMGEHYRREWGTTVDLPVFDIGKEKGGLKIIKRGGGQQTFSLRLEDKDGNQFVLRSVNKDVKKALQRIVHNTLIEDMVQDEISASHPYASLTVPDLAKAAGIYHTNPKIVYVPNDPRFGIYQSRVADQVFLFEERPKGNMEHADNFGNTKKVVGTFDLIKKLENKPDHIVDQKAVVKARLFDIWIGDWDRHDDQWRWASFKEDGKTIYRPIPRDRDQVYFISEGVVMWLISRDFLMPRFQGFNHKISNVKGFQFNARHFDRAFTTEMTPKDWIEQAKILQSEINDSIIDRAMQKLPQEIYVLNGNLIKSKLIARLADLHIYAKQYSEYLSNAVDVVGTDDRDFFDVKRLKGGELEVSRYELSDKKGKVKDLKYRRVFTPEHTREVRLYGLKEKDRFDISGRAEDGIKLRMIGGKGNDTYNDNSFVSGKARKNVIYDRKDKKNTFNVGNESNLQLSKSKKINEYDRLQYTYNKVIPLVSFGYNIDDGVFLGLGAHIRTYNFRDSSIQTINAKHAYKSKATSFRYHGVHTGVSRFYDLELSMELGLPKNVDNFFGLGNNTQKIEEKDDEDDEEKFYRVNYKHVFVNPAMLFNYDKKLSYSFGAFYQFIHITDTSDRFIGTLYPGQMSSNVFGKNSYLGLNAKLNIDTRNDKINPERGIHWVSEASYYKDLNEHNKSFLKLKSDLSTYVSFTENPRFVLAMRFGAATNIGGFDFYHANYLGGKNNLRGYFSNRFGGDSYLYQNTELRIKLLNIRKYLFVGQWGILLYNDVGKVWIKDEISEGWHNGYGFGTWLNPFNATTLNFTYQRSKEEDFFIFRLNFLF